MGVRFWPLCVRCRQSQTQREGGWVLRFDQSIIVSGLCAIEVQSSVESYPNIWHMPQSDCRQSRRCTIGERLSMKFVGHNPATQCWRCCRYVAWSGLHVEAWSWEKNGLFSMQVHTNFNWWLFHLVAPTSWGSLSTE